MAQQQRILSGAGNTWDFTPKAWHRATATAIRCINALGDLRCRAELIMTLMILLIIVDDYAEIILIILWIWILRWVKTCQTYSKTIGGWRSTQCSRSQEPFSQRDCFHWKDALQQLAQGVVGGSFLWDVESHDVAERGAPSAVHKPLRGQILSHFGSRGQVGTRLLRHTALDLYHSISFTIPYLSISINPILIFRGCNVWHRHHKLIQIVGARCLCGSAGGSALRTHAGDETWWNLSCLAIFHNW